MYKHSLVLPLIKGELLPRRIQDGNIPGYHIYNDVFKRFQSSNTIYIKLYYVWNKLSNKVI